MSFGEVGEGRTKWEAVFVPGQLPASDRETCVNVFAVTIEPKLANTFVRQLNQIAPLENLRHVKRVRRSVVDGNVQLTVILCQPHEQGDQLLEMPSDVVELINMHKLHPFVVRVPKYAALTKEEWEEQCKFWPTSYHPPIDRTGTCGLDEEETSIVTSFMQLAIKLAKSGSYMKKVVNAAVIVDPLVRQVIACARDQTCSMPVLSTKCTSEQTTRSQVMMGDQHSQSNKMDSGMIKLSSCDLNGEALPCAAASCLNPWGWVSEQEQAHAPNSSEKLEFHSSWHPLRHAAIVAIELAAARDRDLFPGERIIDKDDLEIPANLTAKRQKRDSSNDDNPVIATGGDATALANGCASSETVHVTRPYLCTGFDAYLVWEPCCLCAMALLHQRIKRIFFAFPNSGAGALGTVHRLHGEKNLNHHYAVFRVLVPNDVLAET
ncbi:tRNA-specific adenosine deaminase TAD3 isoform X2 [Nymphaea colorata]|uniref:tRNA-specific adenosine deaminase TAD3 isoform X2 n=1 Tax=Nymphaea colorata TaxID=210225 RepID=UPI00129E6F13|nr:tRNA-specific adenosine deaminase TAD3 isoform X2 [Nymphaea colorata]